MVLGHDIFTSERTRDVKIMEDVSFDSMLLSPNILMGLKASGFYVPSPIQLYGISIGKCGLDLLLEAKSGTGKTAVFSVVALEKLDLDKGVQTIILAPTREIASQICDVIKTIGANFEGLSVVVVMGGLPFIEDVEKFKEKVHIVVGSPGRLRHLIGGNHIDLSSIRLIVLDEADKLVEKSFLADINYIFSKLPDKKQVIMSSATYPENVKAIISKYLQNPQHVCPDSSSILLGIEQNVTVVPSHVNIVKQTKNRYGELQQILSRKQFKQCLVFCNYQVRVGDVHRMLQRDKWPADKLFGQQEQTNRLEALKLLQEYKCRILVTTDLASRGIDASNVDLVINFEIPHDWQTYLHRIGRAGRYGSYGTAISILSEGDEVERFKTILRSINIPFHLQYLWSREPFILKNSEIEERHLNNDGQGPDNFDKIEIPDNTVRMKETSEELWKMLSIDTAELNNNYHIPSFKSLYDSFEQTSSFKIERLSDMLTSFENHVVKSKESSCYKTVEVNKNIISNNILLDIFEKERYNILKAKENIKANCESIDLHDNDGNVLNSENNENNEPSKSSNNEIENSSINHDTKCDTNNLGMVNGQRFGIINLDDTCQPDSSDNESGCSSLSKSSSEYNDVERVLSSNLAIAFGGSKYQDKTKNEKSDYSIQMVNTNKEVLSKTNNNQINYSANTSKSHKCSNNSQLNDYAQTSRSPKVHKLGNLSKTINNGNSSENSDCAATDYDDHQKALFDANLPTAFGKTVKKKTRSKKYKDYNNSYNEYKINREQVPISNKTIHAKTNIKQRKDDCRQSDDGITCDESNSISHRYFTGKKYTKEYCHYTETDKKYVRYDLPQNVHSTNYTFINHEIEKRQQQINQWYKQLHAYKLMIERLVYIEVMSTSTLNL